MAQLQTLKDRESGQTVYPITSTEAVFDENGVNLKTLLLNQKQSIENALKDYPKKTEVTDALAKKQDNLGTSEDLQITDGNLLSLTAMAKKRLFIDLYNAAFKVGNAVYGKYDPENAPDPDHPFYGNKLWMTYEEAIEVLIAGRPYNNNDTAKFYSRKPIRTNLPFLTYPLSGFGEFAFVNDTAEVFRLSDGDNKITGPYAFYQCGRLHTILGRIKAEIQHIFGQCPKLTNVEVVVKAGITLHLDGCPSLSFESIKYMVDNSESCSLIVHPNTYAKLTGDTTNEAAAALTPEELAQWQQVLTDAVAKNISFATV